MAIVTISRGTFTGGEALAHYLSEKLGYPAVGVEVIKEAAKIYGISEEEISRQLSQGPKTWERLIGEKRRLYLIALQSAMAERAVRGSFIYHGLAGHLLLQGVPSVLKVRLVAPLQYRVRKEMLKKKRTEEEAVKYISRVDEKRKQWSRFFYDVDWTDPLLYDMVLNLEHITIEAAGGLIEYALTQPEFQESPATRQAIEDFALATRVKAQLALSHSLKGLDLDVQAHDGRVRIRGTVMTGKTFTAFGPFESQMNLLESEVVELTKGIPGVTGVTVDLQELPIAVE